MVHDGRVTQVSDPEALPLDCYPRCEPVTRVNAPRKAARRPRGLVPALRWYGAPGLDPRDVSGGRFLCAAMASASTAFGVAIRRRPICAGLPTPRGR